MKLIDTLGEDKYVVIAPPIAHKPYRESEFGVVHDYFYMQDTMYVQKENGQHSDIKMDVKIQIPIRSFMQVMLPKILASEYSKPDHLEPRVSIKDNVEVRSNPYSYNNQVVHYYDKEHKQYMTAILLIGERHFNVVTRKFFDEFIAPNIKY